jgi:hypothetical protein
MTGYNYSMHATWRVKPTSPSALGQRFLRTLDMIAQAAPEIGGWKVVDKLNYIKLANVELLSMDDARKMIGQVLENNVAVVDDMLDANYGYLLLGFNTPTITTRSISWMGSVGGRFGDRITLKAGDLDLPPDLDIVTYRLFRAALLATIAQWPSNWANAYAYRSDYDEVSPAPGIPPHPRSRYLIPWLSYLSARLSADFDPPAEILSERTPDGGLLMIATEERLDPTNPEQMRRSRMMAEIMIAHAGNP